jgi:hypothetical protein
MLNAYQPSKIGAISKRPGTAPVTETDIGPIKHITAYRSATTAKILASSGTSLYKYASDDLTAVTGTLTSADVYDVDFIDSTVTSRKVIADGGSLKAYRDDTETVYTITPAADDPGPAPPNYLDELTAIKYVFAYSGHLFVCEGDDTWYYLKRYTFDYLPSVQYERWVYQNDYMMGPGIAFDNVCLFPMRRGWGILLGSTFDDFQGNLFLNTTKGVIAARTPQRITYPDGTQTIAYLSDDGVQEIYDTGFQDTGSRRYSTRSLMENKIDWDGIGLSDAEKQAATAYFDGKLSLYLLAFSKGSERLVYAYDTRNREWYPWSNIKASSMIRVDDLFYAGATGFLHKFDDELTTDWDDFDQTDGDPVAMALATDVMQLEYSGYQSYLDYLVVSARNYNITSTLDVAVVTYNTTVEYEEALQNQFMVWGTGIWGVGVWANLDFTDFVGAPKRLLFKKRSYYFQILFKNEKAEPVEFHQFGIYGRVSGG